MTLAAIGLLRWPAAMVQGNTFSGALGVGALTFDSTTDRVAYVGRAYQADSINKIYFRTGTVTTGCTIRMQIESVTNGRPSGTIIAAGASGTVAIADTDDNVWKTVSIGTPYTFSVGEEFAIVFTYSSGATPNFPLAATNLEIAGLSGGLYPLLLQDTGAGSWSTSNPLSGGQLEWVVEMTSAGVVAMPNLCPLNGSASVTAFNNTSNPNERALKFVAPVKMRVIGLAVPLFNMAAGADYKASIWDSTDNPGASPTPLAQTETIDGDFAYSATADGLVHLFFPAPVTLDAGTTYYLGIKPETANNLSVLQLDAAGTGAAANAIRAFGMGSVTAHLATRQWVSTDPGAWTNTTTTLLAISLIIDQLDDGASTGGGGLLTHPGMAGGMRG